MTELEQNILLTLKDAFDCYCAWQMEGYSAQMQSARQMIASSADKDNLLGEWYLLSSLVHIGDTEKLLPLYEKARSLIKGRSQVIPYRTPIMLDYENPLFTFHKKPGSADREAKELSRALMLYHDMTGGGTGTDTLFHMRLFYLRGDLTQAMNLAQQVWQIADDESHELVKLEAAEMFAFLLRHGVESRATYSALQYLNELSCGASTFSKRTREMAQLLRSNIYLSLGILTETPEWVKIADFGVIADSERALFRSLENKLSLSSMLSAQWQHVFYLASSKQFTRMLNAIDMAQKVLHISHNLLLNVYFDCLRALGFFYFADKVNARKFLLSAIEICAADEMWLLLAEFAPDSRGEMSAFTREFSVFLLETAAEFDTNIVSQIRDFTSFWDKVLLQRKAYQRAAEISLLSPREREVAAYAAEGMTNREIAKLLCVSEKTINTHMEHTYAKLRVSRRSRVAEALRRQNEPQQPLWFD